jgi:hypothetical protein
MLTRGAASVAVIRRFRCPRLNRADSIVGCSLPTDGFVAQDLYCAVMGFLWHYEGCAAAAVSETRGPS